jgi:hypothetical protein
MFQPLISGPASSFPAKETWLDFDTLFNLNMSELSASGDTNTDVDGIRAAIHQNAELVESRIILCIIMQESSGNVGVQTTGDDDAGLMQAQGSPGFPSQHGLSQVRFRTGGIQPIYGALLTMLTYVQDQITSMVTAGTMHFKGNLEELGNGDDAATIYSALRLYNSGKLNANDLSDGEGATPSYVSDIAYRLQGRVDGDFQRTEL